MNNAFPADAPALPEENTPVTAKFAAAQEFEPWDSQSNCWRPPSNAEWNQIGEWLLPVVRVAWLIMFKTKSELVDMVEEMDRKEIYLETMQNLYHAEKTIDGFLQVVHGAVARTICAGAVIEVRDGEAERGDDEQL